MIGPAQRLISGVDTISQNFKTKQMDYHQWDINALVETAIAIAQIALRAITSCEGNHQFPFRKLQLKPVLFQLRAEPPLCNHRMTQIPGKVRSSGACNNVELFASLKILLPQKCKGRGTLPQASQGLLEGPCSLGPCDMACWVLSPLGWGSVGQNGILGKEGDSEECSTSYFL